MLILYHKKVAHEGLKGSGTAPLIHHPPAHVHDFRDNFVFTVDQLDDHDPDVKCCMDEKDR